MQVSEWREITEQVQALWGRSQKWAGAADAYRYVRSVSASDARAAVESLFLDGSKTAPSPSEVIAAARRGSVGEVTAEEVAIYCSEHGHAYGIVEDTPALRVGVCRRCRAVLETVPHLLTTQAEREAGEVWQPDELTDRIAP